MKSTVEWEPYSPGGYRRLTYKDLLESGDPADFDRIIDKINRFKSNPQLTSSISSLQPNGSNESPHLHGGDISLYTASQSRISKVFKIEVDELGRSWDHDANGLVQKTMDSLQREEKNTQLLVYRWRRSLSFKSALNLAFIDGIGRRLDLELDLLLPHFTDGHHRGTFPSNRSILYLWTWKRFCFTAQTCRNIAFPQSSLGRVPIVHLIQF